MARHRRFLFDNEFDVAGHNGRAIDDAATRQHVEQARQEGYQEGRAAGRREAEAERAKLEADALARIAREVGAIAQRHAESFDHLRGENLALALSIGRKLAARLIAAQPLAEIEGLVEDSLRRLLGEQRIVIRLHHSLLDAMQSRLDTLARRTGFGGEVILLAEDDIAPGDCRVEWADGGATRCAATIEREIDALFERVLGTPGSAEGAAGA